ncbi:vWA domain-containing protein [Actinokineospora cianjurensis]|uniref:Mg-chelatase subunit ChlD n=1 Tax=Actinokineospora cianjurensis TaxID=585224 RepID=A0A421B6A5_9PSEU|nr:VWA domain-containing protein [Actinokineospora cianjurensis]RLK59971.1 Mg-chelatase subunit ChlD [Actinokineospora cianjurensis]
MSHSADKHTSILAVDVESYGDVRRTDRHQKVVRDGLYAALHRALDRAELPWGYHEDRGDGLFLLIPDVPKGELVASLPHELAAALREHNADHGPETQIRLKVAIHAGEVGSDDNGKHGTDLNHTFRLLESQPLRSALAGSPGVLALAVSDWFYEHVVKHQPAANPAIYRSHTVQQKETKTTAWICTPDYPRPVTPTPTLRLPTVQWPKLPKVRLPRPRWQAVVLTALLLLAPMTNLLAGAAAPAMRCANPVQLNVLTSTEMAPTLRLLALNFERKSYQADENRCRQARVLVVADTYGGAVDALGQGWSGRNDLRDHGPEPHVWIPDSSIDIDHVAARLARVPGIGATLEPRPGIARSPIVLAAPKAMVDALRPTDGKWVTWQSIALAASSGDGFTRPDPRSSSAGMLATIAYYRHRLEQPELTSTAMTGDSVPRVVHSAEREIPYAPDLDSGNLLCTIRNRPGQTAALVSEKAVIDYNRGRQLGSDCSASVRPEALTPLYLQTESPVQDYPFVVVRWTDRPEHHQRHQVIDRFYEYLMSPPASADLHNSGFRHRDGLDGGPVLSTALPVGPATAFDLIQTAAAVGSTHPRVLFAVDTGLSMSAPFQRGTRVQAATELVRRLLQQFGDDDEVGLMTFGTTTQDIVPLAPDQTTAIRKAARPDFPLTPGDSDVYGAIEAGMERLRADKNARGTDLLVIITDSATADVSQTDMPALKMKVTGQDPRVTRLLVVNLLTGRCESAGLTELAKAAASSCVDLTSVEDDIPKLSNLVAAGLWRQE